jgi:hypothetical protein
MRELFHQRVVVGGEQRPTADVLGQFLDYSAGDGRSIIRRCTPSYKENTDLNIAQWLFHHTSLYPVLQGEYRSKYSTMAIPSYNAKPPKYSNSEHLFSPLQFSTKPTMTLMKLFGGVLVLNRFDKI